MAQKIENPYGNKGEAYKFPSYFGSHASMIDQPLTDAIKQLQAGQAPDVPKEQMALLNKLASLMGDDGVVIKDEHKEPYVTSRKVLDNGLADPNRYATNRVAYLCNQKKD